MRNRLLFLGITGGVGAGKTTVLKFIADHFPTKILSGDQIARELCLPGQSVYEEIRRAFPDPALYLSDGAMDRSAFAAQIFSDEEKRKALNALVHPAVKRYIINEFESTKREGAYAYLVLEAALLIEEHYDEICDELWYVHASEETRKQRLMESRGYSAEKIKQIFQSQLPENVYRHHCAAVIDNDGTREAMERSVRRAFERIEGELG